MKEKEGNERIFEVMPEYVTLKQGARDRLLRPEGIEMRVNRSCQVEGTFGVLKQNMLIRGSADASSQKLGLNLH